MAQSNAEQVVIRSWPKVIFLYPVMVSSLLCGVWQKMQGGINSDSADTAATIFLVVLCLNVLVISFEFSRFKTLAIMSLLVALFFLLLFLNTRWDVFPFIRSLFGKFDPRVSESFYFTLGVYLLIVFGFVFLSTRFDYWVIKSNEILHKEGFLGDVRRFPSPNLKMTKEINDVFEFLLSGAGRMILYPAGEKQAMVLNHVLWVNRKEKRIQDLLSALSVEIAGHEYVHDDDNVGVGIGD